ncbi:MAG TPA: hypothetical protein VF407_16230 [Polyangiaceae bacterium]
MSSASLLVAACSGDDITEGPADSGIESDSSFTGDGSIPGDSSTPTDGATEDAGVARPPWTLLSMNYKTESDMAAFSLDAGAVDGVLTYPGSIGLTSLTAEGPWLLEQSKDLVVKLDPSAPWRGGASWNVHGTEDAGAGLPYADPYQVVLGPAGKAYVPRFNRNALAVIDTTQNGDASAPTKLVDLSQFLESGDEDGNVDMVGGVYVASQHRVYVLLASFDLYLTDPVGYFTVCGSFHSKLVAIDTDTDTVVSPTDAGAPSAVTLPGYNAIALLPDFARHRLLAVNAGCNDEGVPDSGMPGTLHMREVDAFDLSTGTASKVLDLTGYPSAIALVDDHTLALGFDFGFSANLWDVSTNALGAEIPNAPDVFGYDGQGHLVGAKTDYLADGGMTHSIVSVSVADGGSTTIAPVPLRSAGFVGAADFWP